MKKFHMMLVLGSLIFVSTSAFAVFGYTESSDKYSKWLTISTKEVLGKLTIGASSSPIVLEGATADAYETSITVEDATADRTVTIPDLTGTVQITQSESADPCGSNPVGYIYFSAGGMFCGCGLGSVDIKLDGSSAACTY